MRTGWQIIIAGRNFEPSDFFKASRIQPSERWERECYEDSVWPSCPDTATIDERFALIERSETFKPPDDALRYRETVIEFSDWRDGPYPLDMPLEALDYIMANREEFEQLCRWPGIDECSLNFFDNLDGQKISAFDFQPTWLTILGDLKFKIHISVLTAASIDSVSTE